MVAGRSAAGAPFSSITIRRLVASRDARIVEGFRQARDAPRPQPVVVVQELEELSARTPHAFGEVAFEAKTLRVAVIDDARIARRVHRRLDPLPRRVIAHDDLHPAARLRQGAPERFTEETLVVRRDED